MNLTKIEKRAHAFWRPRPRILEAGCLTDFGGGEWFGGGVERSAGCLLLALVLSGLGRRGLFGKVIDLGAATGPLPYRICRAVKIAIMADVNTTGLFLRAQIAAGAVRIATFVLRNTSSAGSAGSVGIPVAAAGSTCRSAISRGR
jgi:hypothetical protein